MARTGRTQTEEAAMPVAGEIRLAAVNIGVCSREELATAADFWSALLQVSLDDWDGQGRSRQARVGDGPHAFFITLRVRDEREGHFGHRAAFGIAVAGLDEFRRRALAQGASELYPPAENEAQPRHFLLQDPVGNRVTVWQG